MSSCQDELFRKEDITFATYDPRDGKLTMQVTPEEKAEIERLRVEATKKGQYWLTARGREELHEIFDSDDSPVAVLLARVEQLEDMIDSALSVLEDDV